MGSPQQHVADDDHPRKGLIDYALQYAGRGWRVFPLKPGGKTPLVSRTQGGRGFLDATCEPRQIEAWWAAQPDANIGLATGAGIIVVDIDGPEGLAELKALAAKHGPLPATLAARTGSGVHLYFAGEGVKSSARGKLHIRGDGGYVVLPPSLHPSGQVYSWIPGAPTLAPLPNWSREYAEGPREKQEGPLRRIAVPAYLADRPRRALADLALMAIRRAESTWSEQEQRRVESALQAIPASCGHDTWIKLAPALKSLQWVRSDGTDFGLELWDAWSATCPEKYPGRGHIEYRWNSFRDNRADRIGIATLFDLAKQHGWNGQAVDRQSVDHAPGVNGTASTAAVLPAIFSDATPQAITFPDLNDTGQPRRTCANASAAIELMGLKCSYDLFHNRKLIAGHILTQYAGELSDDIVFRLRWLIHKTFRFDPGLANTHDAAIQLCLVNSFNPVLDYLASLQWDGISRIDSWLSVYLSAPADELYSIWGRLALIAAVRRVRRPGAKFDQVIVLEGPEGKNKSMAIRILAGNDNFNDQTILTASDRHQQELMEGVWLYEIQDLAGIHRAEVEKVKAFTSRTVDRTRPAYGRHRVDRPRTCIFFATTNAKTYLPSQTGNRRFWPIPCGRVDLEALERDRDQLWAEAAHHEATGASIVLPEKYWAPSGELQEARREIDEWETVLRGVKGKAFPNDAAPMEFRISSLELLEAHLRLTPDRMFPVTAKRLANVMHKLGWEGPKLLKDHANTYRGYCRAVTAVTDVT